MNRLTRCLGDRGVVQSATEALIFADPSIDFRTNYAMKKTTIATDEKTNPRLIKLENKVRRAESKLAKTEAKLLKRKAKLVAAREAYEALRAVSGGHSDDGTVSNSQQNGDRQPDPGDE
jgi:hypothetical protein